MTIAIAILAGLAVPVAASELAPASWGYVSQADRWGTWAHQAPSDYHDTFEYHAPEHCGVTALMASPSGGDDGQRDHSFRFKYKSLPTAYSNPLELEPTDWIVFPENFKRYAIQGVYTSFHSTWQAATGVRRWKIKRQDFGVNEMIHSDCEWTRGLEDNAYPAEQFSRGSALRCPWDGFIVGLHRDEEGNYDIKCCIITRAPTTKSPTKKPTKSPTKMAEGEMGCWNLGDSKIARDDICEGDLKCARKGHDGRDFGCEEHHCCTRKPTKSPTPPTKSPTKSINSLQTKLDQWCHGTEYDNNGDTVARKDVGGPGSTNQRWRCYRSSELDWDVQGSMNCVTKCGELRDCWGAVKGGENTYNRYFHNELLAEIDAQKVNTCDTPEPTPQPTTAEFEAEQLSKIARETSPWETAKDGDTIYKCEDEKGCYKSELGSRHSFSAVADRPSGLGNVGEYDTTDGKWTVTGESMTFNGDDGVAYEFPFDCACSGSE